MEIANFIERNEGALVGAIGGVTIAIIASFLTHALFVFRQREKEKNAYLGLLQTLRIELYYQRQQFSLIEEIMSNLQIASVKNEAFIVESIPIRLNLSISEAILSKIIDYKKYERNIVAILTMYLNQLRDINFYLDFKNAREVLDYVNENRTVEEAINTYFAVFHEEYIDKAQTGNSNLHKLIEKELKLFPEVVIQLPKIEEK